MVGKRKRKKYPAIAPSVNECAECRIFWSGVCFCGWVR